MKKEYIPVIDGISNLIRSHMEVMSGEYNEPKKSPDASDHYICTHEKAIKELKDIRERLEVLYSRKDYLEP